MMNQNMTTVTQDFTSLLQQIIAKRTTDTINNCMTVCDTKILMIRVRLTE